MEPITSVHNSRIQRVRALLNQKSARDAEKAFIIEGVRLCEEALMNSSLPTEVFFSASLSERGKKAVSDANAIGAETIEVNQSVIDNLSATETSQGILMVLPQLSTPLSENVDFVLILDQIRDPGNMGTILRSAAASGVQIVFVPTGNADIYSPKVVRSGMGAHFHLCLAVREWAAITDFCKSQNSSALQMMLAESGDGMSCWQADMRQPLALVIGGEAEGACPEAKLAVDSFVHIPMPGNFESLNAAVAASILLFEVVRQRSQE